jgi:protein TonB
MLISKFDLYKREWLDLVFADRNKSYGAYELRKHSGDYVIRALAITVLSFTTAYITISIVYKPTVKPDKPTEQVIPDIPITPIKQIKDKPLEPKLRHVEHQSSPAKADAAPKTTVPTKQFVEYKPTVEPTKIEELEGKAVGPVTQQGDPNSHAANVDTESGKGGKGTDPGANIDNTVHGAGEGLDMLPEPIGGTAAWSKFLQKNLHYPSTEAQGRVIISFVVEKDGSLTDITVLKGVSPELDNEAMRVIKKAPAWKPGVQNGRPVRVKFTVPIVFQFTEQ